MDLIIEKIKQSNYLVGWPGGWAINDRAAIIYSLKETPYSSKSTLQCNTIQVYCVILLASGVALHEVTHQLVYRYST